MIFWESLFNYSVWILVIVFDLRDLRFVDGFIVAHIHGTCLHHGVSWYYWIISEPALKLHSRYAPSVGGITAQSVQPQGEIPEEGRTEKKLFLVSNEKYGTLSKYLISWECTYETCLLNSLFTSRSLYIIIKWK